MKITRTILPVAAVVYALTTAADTLHAQYEILGVIAGQVTDWRGAALPAAHIDVTDRETGQRAMALTDADGHYILEGLATDHHFTLHVRCIGFVPRTEPDVRAVPAADGARPESLTLTLVPIEKRLAVGQKGDN
jgi:hypothetical protein